MALAACQHPAKHTVCLHARDDKQAQAMRQQKQNARYLPGIAFPEGLHIDIGRRFFHQGGKRRDPGEGKEALVKAIKKPGCRCHKKDEPVIGREQFPP